MTTRRLFLRMIAGVGSGAVLGPRVLDAMESLPAPELLAWQDELAALCHDIFVGRIAENVHPETPLMKLFTKDPQRFAGQAMVFHTDLKYEKT